MKVMFSPVGTADPLTTLGDGPMLHICRQYRPEVVVLYLSAEMARNEEADQRYTKAIELLRQQLDGWSPQVRVIEDRDLEVWRFDAPIAEFRSRLQVLTAEFSEAELLLNASSGTAQLNAALVSIHTFGIFNTAAIQVTTPKNAANKPNDREQQDDYDLQTLWELNFDNSQSLNRCEEIASPHLSDLIRLENVRTLIGSYEYAVALHIYSGCCAMNQSAKKLILGASKLIILDVLGAREAFRGTAATFDSMTELGAYLAMLEVRVATEEIADFARALEPAVTETNRAIGRRYGAPQQGAAFDGGLNNHELRKFMKEQCRRSHATAEDTRRVCTLADANEKARNFAAHNMKRLTGSVFREKAGASPKQILDALFQANSDLQPGMFNRINEMILAELDRHN